MGSETRSLKFRVRIPPLEELTLLGRLLGKRVRYLVQRPQVWPGPINSLLVHYRTIDYLISSDVTNSHFLARSAECTAALIELFEELQLTRHVFEVRIEHSPLTSVRSRDCVLADHLIGSVTRSQTGARPK